MSRENHYEGRGDLPTELYIFSYAGRHRIYGKLGTAKGMKTRTINEATRYGRREPARGWMPPVIFKVNFDSFTEVQ